VGSICETLEKLSSLQKIHLSFLGRIVTEIEAKNQRNTPKASFFYKISREVFVSSGRIPRKTSRNKVLRSIWRHLEQSKEGVLRRILKFISSSLRVSAILRMYNWIYSHRLLCLFHTSCSQSKRFESELKLENLIDLFKLNKIW